MGWNSARLQMVTLVAMCIHSSQLGTGKQTPHTSTPILALTPPPGEEHGLRTEAACLWPAVRLLPQRTVWKQQESEQLYRRASVRAQGRHHQGQGTRTVWTPM